MRTLRPLRPPAEGRRRQRRLGRLLSSVRVRMTLWYLAILTLVFVVFGTIVSVIVVRDALIAEQNRLSSVWQQIASTYNAAEGKLDYNGGLATKPVISTKTLLLPPAPGGPDVIVMLVDSRGGLVQTFGPLDDMATERLQLFLIQDKNEVARFGGRVDTFSTLSVPMPTGDGQTVQLQYAIQAMSITSQGTQVATLLVGEPFDSNGALQALAPALLVAGPLTLLVAAVGGYWLATRAMRPVRLITRTAREIGETDLSRRLNLTRQDELGELAATFDDMLARLEAAFARQRQFTADASHELRTPLAIVSLETRRALLRRQTQEEYERALAVIQAESDYMSRLVNGLLTLARADAGQTVLERVDVDLGDVVVDVMERLAPLAAQRGSELALGELAELTVEGDPLYLTQMVGNLVENAIKYGRAGGHVHVECAPGAAERAGWARVQVADDGPGIGAEHLGHIFDRFYRVDEGRGRADEATARDAAPGAGSEAANGMNDVDDEDGSGLGLAIVQWVAAVHGGEVTVESAEGAGSIFTVWLPLAVRKASVLTTSRLPPHHEDTKGARHQDISIRGTADQG
jgi:signal transduction histidine kinase